MKITTHLAILLITVLFIGIGQAYAIEQNFYSYNANNAAGSLRENADKVDTIHPQKFVFTTKFKVEEIADGGIERVAKDEEVKVIPLIHQDNFSRTLMTAILLIKPLQKSLVDQLIEIAEDRDYDGWQYDFENITPGEKDAYTKFVEYSANRFKDEGLEFSVAIVPRQANYRPGVDDPNWSVAYDLRKIADAADYVVLMAYDDPYSKGPTASYDFTKRTIDYALTQTDSGKLSLGVPLYCWKWYLTDGYRRRGALSHPLTQEDFDESLGGFEGYSDTFKSEWSIYRVASGNIYVTWCDGVRGFESKLDLIERYNLRGFSAWAIGQEDEGIWDLLEN